MDTGGLKRASEHALNGAGSLRIADRRRREYQDMRYRDAEVRKLSTRASVADTRRPAEPRAA